MREYSHKYPSDITREQFEIVHDDLRKAKKSTKPRDIELYDIFCAILYIVKGGIQWRMLPSDFPKWGAVRYYYDVWSAKREDGGTLLSKVLKKLVTTHRNDDLRKDKTSFGIIDAQSVQNADTAKEKGYDAGKKVSGIKRHIIVDTMGLPHALLVTKANVADRDGAIEMITINLDNLSSVEKFLVDGGYSGNPFADTVKKLCGAEVEVVKRDDCTNLWFCQRDGWLKELLAGWTRLADFGKTVSIPSIILCKCWSFRSSLS
jgi:transposase